MSVRNKSFSLQDAKALQWFVNFMEGVLEACDGDPLIGPNTEALSHHAELTDEDNYFNFTIEEQRAIDLEVARKQNNVLTLQSCTKTGSFKILSKKSKEKILGIDARGNLSCYAF